MTNALDGRQLRQFDIDTETWLSRKKRVQELYKRTRKEYKSIIKLIPRLKELVVQEGISQLSPEFPRVTGPNPKEYFPYKKKIPSKYVRDASSGHMSSSAIVPSHVSSTNVRNNIENTDSSMIDNHALNYYTLDDINHRYVPQLFVSFYEKSVNVGKFHSYSYRFMKKLSMWTHNILG